MINGGIKFFVGEYYLFVYVVNKGKLSQVLIEEFFIVE